jgi:hypothetical protein
VSFSFLSYDMIVDVADWSRLDYYKHAHVQQAPVEMHSPQPGQNEFGAAELDGSSGQKAAGKP